MDQNYGADRVASQWARQISVYLVAVVSIDKYGFC
jgi:hypothetical protein